jgi:enoyl-CoA hydratase/carnithine racemase
MMSKHAGIRKIEHPDGVVELQFDLNEKNTLNEEAFLNFSKLLTDLGDNKESRSVILSSASEEYFSNGLDPEMFVDRDFQHIHRAVDIILHSTLELLRLRQPVVAAISGHCMGAGAVFALLSDYRLMSAKKGRIGFPEIRIGLSFPSGAAALLVELVGQRAARELLFDGKPLKAEQARTLGLVDEVCAPADLMPSALKLATSLAKKPPMAIQAIKLALKQRARVYMEERMHDDRDWLVRTIHSKHGQEGFQSILENRRPVFE